MNRQIARCETCNNRVVNGAITMYKVSCWENRSFELDPRHTALIVVDMQRDFVADDGYVGLRHHKRNPLSRIIPDLLRVIAAARSAGLFIIHTREGYAADGSDVNGYKRDLEYVGTPGPGGPFLIRGFYGHDFFNGFGPVGDEIVIDKAGFSAFYNTDLHSDFTQRKITHLILTGVTTQCCVHSTLRDAVERGYFCLTLEDCCAAEDMNVHAAAMRVIQSENHLFGWIARESDFTQAISKGMASKR